MNDETIEDFDTPEADAQALESVWGPEDCGDDDYCCDDY